jgi:hypothetical protein
MGKKSRQKGNAKVIVPVIIGTLLLLVGVLAYFMLVRNSRSLLKATMSSKDNKANESISLKTAISSMDETSKFINCGSIKLPLPQEWQSLKNIDAAEAGTRKYDANGCLEETEETKNTECLCIKKNPQSDKKNIIFSVITTPTMGKDLVDCTSEASKSYFLNASASALKEGGDKGKIKEESLIFFGERALKLSFSSPEQIHSTLFFIKDCKFYSFDLVSTKSEHDILWSQIEKNISKVRF